MFLSASQGLLLARYHFPDTQVLLFWKKYQQQAHNHSLYQLVSTEFEIHTLNNPLRKFTSKFKDVYGVTSRSICRGLTQRRRQNESDSPILQPNRMWRFSYETDVGRAAQPRATVPNGVPVSAEPKGIKQPHLPDEPPLPSPTIDPKIIAYRHYLSFLC